MEQCRRRREDAALAEQRKTEAAAVRWGFPNQPTNKQTNKLLLAPLLTDDMVLFGGQAFRGDLAAQLPAELLPPAKRPAVA